jgi:purine-binding chemotaxis protein CheW
MDEEKRFLILSLEGESYAIPITRLVEISAPRQIQKDPKLTEVFEGKVDYRGKWVPVINLRRVFKIQGGTSTALLIIKSAKGVLGILVDAVSEIITAEQQPAPLPQGVINPSIRYYRGILRHRDGLVLLLNEDQLLP